MPEAVSPQEPLLAADRMRAHLEGVRDGLQAWDPAASPLATAGTCRAGMVA